MEIYEKIGPAGIALLGVAIVCIYIFIRNSIYLYLIDRQFRQVYLSLDDPAHDLLAPSLKHAGNPLLTILREVARNHSRHSRDLYSEMAFLFHKNFYAVNISMAILRLSSVIAPLLGLMGTVLGIRRIFAALGEQTAETTALASGIGEALLTTVMGLTITIPALIFFYLIKFRIGGFQVEMMEYANRITEELTDEKQVKKP